MGLMERVRHLLLSGSGEDDPDEFVDLTVVRVFEGPLLIAKLHDAGIEAIGDEAFNVGTQVRSDYRVMVRRRDLEAAVAAAS